MMKSTSVKSDFSTLEIMIRKRIELGLWERAIKMYNTMQKF